MQINVYTVFKGFLKDVDLVCIFLQNTNFTDLLLHNKQCKFLILDSLAI